MFSTRVAQVWAVLAWTVAAVPTPHTTDSESLFEIFDKAAMLNFTTSSPETTVSYPNDTSFDTDTYRWTDWSAPTFSAAFLPATEEDLSTGLKFMTDNNLPFLATSGAHGSTVTLESLRDGVAINLQKFNKVTYNETDETISVGGGAHFGAIWTTAYQAERELPLASACVGVGGCTAGGGHGWLQGKYGLVIDAMTEMRVALWNGSIVRASTEENPDLFWAMRGAGHNFGIMVEFTLRTWPQTNQGKIHNYDMAFSDESLEGVVAVLNDIVPTQPADLGFDFTIMTNATTGKPVIFLGMIYFGDKEEGDQYAARFATTTTSSTSTTLPSSNSSFPSNSTTTTTPMIDRTFLNATTARWDQLSDVAAGGFIGTACATDDNSDDDDQQKHYVDVYTTTMNHIDPTQTRHLYESYKQFTAQNPSASTSTIVWEIFAQQGIKAPDSATTAYANREYVDILFLIQGVFGGGDDDSSSSSVGLAADSWAKKWRDTFTDPRVSGYDDDEGEQQHVYLNYAHGDEPLGAMYGYEEWRLERLRELKGRYDPRGFFNHFNSVFGTAAAGGMG